MEAILGIVVALFQLYPFTFEQTFILLGILKAAYDSIRNRQWSKLEKVVMDEAIPLFQEALSNEAKRDLVVKAVWNKMPRNLRAFASADQVEKFVDMIYQTQVKPEAKRQKIKEPNMKKSDVESFMTETLIKKTEQDGWFDFGNDRTEDIIKPSEDDDGLFG